MAPNSYKIHDVEKKCFWGIQKYKYCKNGFLNHINEMPPHGGRELIWHAISLHPMIDEKHTQTKNMCKDQYADRYSHLKLQICRKTM